MINLNIIAPEIFLFLSIATLLMIGVFKQNSYSLILNLSFLSLIGTGFLIFLNFGVNEILLESFISDPLSSFSKILISLSCLFVLFSSQRFVKDKKISKFEYPIIILLSVLGMFFMVSSNDLILFYLGLELQSLSLYILASFDRKNIKSAESGIKYFVLSALSSGLLLYGCSLIYGFSGSTNFHLIAENVSKDSYGLTFGIIFIITGLAFKISAVPFHMWAPDVYEGSPTSVTIFFAILPKIAALTVFIRILYVPFFNIIDQWQIIIVFLSIASMLFGSIAAIGQKNLKRLIAYSSIGHMGYALAGLSTGTNQGIQSSITYISIYLFMNLAFFACLFMLRRDEKYFENIEDLSGLSKNHPILSFSFLVVLFSLAGIPPLVGFFAKFYIFTAVIEQSMYSLAIIGLLSTVIAAFYYLRIIKVIYFDPEKEKFEKNHNIGLKISLTVSTIFILFYFIYPSPLIEIIEKINII